MKIHIVQKGDTLAKIANEYGIDLGNLISFNPQLSSPDMIMPGMKVKIPTETKPVQKEKGQKLLVTEQKDQKVQSEADEKKEQKKSSNAMQERNSVTRPIGDAIEMDEQMKKPVKAHYPRTFAIQEEQTPYLKKVPTTIHGPLKERESQRTDQNYNKDSTLPSAQADIRYEGTVSYDDFHHRNMCPPYWHQQMPYTYPQNTFPRYHCPCCPYSNEYSHHYRPYLFHHPYGRPY